LMIPRLSPDAGVAETLAPGVSCAAVFALRRRDHRAFSHRNKDL
jgi:hypothetical protein